MFDAVHGYVHASLYVRVIFIEGQISNVVLPVVNVVSRTYTARLAKERGAMVSSDGNLL